MSVLVGIALAIIVTAIPGHNTTLAKNNSQHNDTIKLETVILTCVGFGPAIFCGVVLLICSLIAFRANVIQFGTDQLNDSPSDHSVLFIHWFVCTSFAGQIPGKCLFPFISNANINISHATLVMLDVPIICLLSPFLGITLCLLRYKPRWFAIDTGSKNPYTLVYRVLKFAKQHSNPIRRSAFTFCEDELPSRFDLGKEKYGGPFTTEQVEDVKAFLGILCILLTLGPVLTVDIAVSDILPYFASHLSHSEQNESSINSIFETLLIFDATLTPLLIVVFMFIHLCLLRRFIQKYIPGMLKRIGLGMILILLSALCTLSMDTYGYVHYSNNATCFLTYNFTDELDVNIYSLAVQSSLNAFGYILLYTAVFEFICAQSPQAMKGVLIGIFFAIKGVFQLIGIIILLTPFTQLYKWQKDFPSCGFIYYIINSVLALIGLVAYTVVARRYQYRQRDDPDNVYRYAEEYYANARDDPYSDYDDLSVESSA